MDQELQTILKEASDALLQSIRHASPSPQKSFSFQATQGTKETLLIRCRDAIFSLQQELKEEREIKQELQTNFKKANEQIQLLQVQLQDTQQKATKVSDINLDQESQIFNLKQQIAHQTVEIEKLNDNKKSLEQQIEEKDNFIQKLEAKNQNLEQEIIEQAEINKQLNEQLTQIDSSLQQSKIDFEEAQKNNLIQEKQIQQILADKLELERQIDDLHMKFQQKMLDEKYYTESRENMILATFKKEKDQNNVMVQKQLEEAQKKIDTLKIQNSKLKKEIMQYQELNKELKQKQELLEIAISQKQRDFKNLKQEFKNKEQNTFEEQSVEKEKLLVQLQQYEQETQN